MAMRYFFLALPFLLTCSTTPSKIQSQVYVLGTIHGNMLDNPANGVRHFVTALYVLSPTLIINESRPEFPGPVEGIIDGGPEQGLVYAYAMENKIPIVGADWFDDAFNVESEREDSKMSENLKAEIAPLFERFR